MNSTLSVVVDCRFVDHTSCIPLSSSTSVMSPVMIFFRESLNSFSCSKVSFFVSSYSSSSSSSLKYTTKAKLTNTGIHKQFFWCGLVHYGTPNLMYNHLVNGHFYLHSSRSCNCCISLSSCSSKFCLNFPVSDFPREAILYLPTKTIRQKEIKLNDMTISFVR